MPVPLPAASMEEIRAPLNVIQRVLASSPSAVEEHFNSALQYCWDQVPLLNDVEHVEQLQPGSLVRFRCMIQNIYNPEWYLSEFDHVHEATGERTRAFAKYSELLTPPPGFKADHSDATSVTSERTPLHCMSIPHESDWVKLHLASPIKFQKGSSEARTKRRLESGEGQEMREGACTEADATMECEGAAEDTKRTKQEEEVAPSAGAAMTDAGSSNSAAQRPPLVAGAEASHAAIVKVYYEGGAEAKHKVNEAVEFVGVLCLDPEGATFPGQAAAAGLYSAEELRVLQAEDEMGAGSGASAPTSVLPRIHAILHRPLSSCWNPALCRLSETEQLARKQLVASRSMELRNTVVGALRAALGGDALAAEYTLCHLLSRVCSRPHNLPVGKLSLAISGFPHAPAGSQSSAGALVEALQQLLPSVGYLPMTTKGLGDALMVPRKDYDTEMLHSGALQLTPGTQLVVDESTMEPGQLNETGVKNMSALQSLIAHQLLPFDFSFYNVEMPMDVSVLVVSEAKPLLNVDCLVRLQPDAQQADQQPVHQLGPDVLELCRTLLGMARNIEVELSDEICHSAENHFVQARQEDAKVDQDTLHRWLTLARLLAASHGESSVTPERWQQVMAMEATRHGRMAAA